MFGLFGGKKKKMNDEQKKKLNSIKDTMKKLEAEIEKLLLTEPRVLPMNDYQIIYSIAHVRFEDVILKELEQKGEVAVYDGRTKPLIIKADNMKMPEPHQSPDEEFETDKANGRKTYH